MLQTESRRDDEAARQRRERHAVAVACWAAVIVEPDPDRPGKERQRYGVAIRNASNTVVYDITIRQRNAARPTQTDISLSQLPPDTYFVEEQGKRHWEFAKPLSEIDGDVRPVTKGESRPVVEFLFRDAANIHWLRVDDGLLQCVEPERESRG